MTDPSPTTVFRAIGFCGADDSVDPSALVSLSQQYPHAEFGVLFRPDREGQPRYARREWVDGLADTVARTPSARLQLAAHLCGARVQQVLEGTREGWEFLQQLEDWGFRRVQINATAVNGVDTSNLADQAASFSGVVERFPNLEFILQRNQETRPLWEGMLSRHNDSLPKNVTMLVDESKGTGVLAHSWPSPPINYDIGYAGGIGPDNVGRVILEIQAVAPGRNVWIDMESSLRTQTEDGTDVFDLGKCQRVLQVVQELGVRTVP